jgi:hypothetical protein
MSMKREAHKQALQQLLDLYAVQGGVVFMTGVQALRRDTKREQLVEEILKVSDRFNHNVDEALNSGERRAATPPDRHVSSIINDAESFRRGGSTRIASCTCGWVGPQRSTMELAADDAIEHERSRDTP